MLINLGRGLSPFYSSIATATPPTTKTLSDFSFAYAEFAPKNTNTQSTTLNVSFDPVDVDTTTNEIDFGSDLGFGLYGSGATAIRFLNTGGALPSPLVANTDYYLVQTTDNKCKVYPIAQDSDWTILNNAVEGENILPAQHAVQQENGIDLTNQGTGTHPLILEEACLELRNSLSKEYAAGTTSNINSYLPVKTDGAGRKYLEAKQEIRTPTGDGGYDIYGKKFNYGTYGSGSLGAFKAESAEKRIITHTYIVELEDYTVKGMAKAYCDTASVNVSTNVITCNSHVIQSGWRCRVKANIGDTLPTGLAEDTDYWATDNGGNTLSFATEQNAFDIGLPTDINLDGNIGGNSRNFGEWLPNLTNGYCKVELSFTALANDRPTKNDVGHVGEPLADGTYWATPYPNQTRWCRLHKTEQHAIDAVGVHHSLIPAGELITYATKGSNYSFFLKPVGVTRIGFGFETGSNAFQPDYYPLTNNLMALTTVVDYNNPAETNVIGKVYVNGILVDTIDTGVAKGITNTAVGSSVGALLNSMDGHVPLVGKFYGIIMGNTASNDVTDADISSLYNDYIKPAYNL